MLMDLVVEIPMDLIREAAEISKKVGCKRKQAVFNLFPDGVWRLGFVCGTNRGIGSDNGYGVGHTCEEKCKLRIPFSKCGGLEATRK